MQSRHETHGAWSAQAASAGREALVSDRHGITVAVIVDPTSSVGFAITAVGPMELFPQKEPSKPPAWTDRLTGLINQIGETS